MPKKNYVSGFGEKDPDAAEFLKANTNPWKASASGEGYQGRRWDDDTGYKRGEYATTPGQNTWDNEASDVAFRKPSQSETDWDAPHEKLSVLIDGQKDFGSGNKLTGGGGPVSDNKVGGVGAGKPRFKPKTGPQGNDGL